MASALDTAVESSEVSAEEIPAILERIEPIADLGEAIVGAEIVVEVVTEDLRVKEKVWRSMGKTAAEEVGLVTNTSSYGINWFGDHVPHPSASHQHPLV